MTITLVSTTPYYDQGHATSGSTISVTASHSPLTSGDVLIAVIGIRQAGSGSITVSSISQSGATWSKQANQTSWDNQPDDMEIWFGVIGSSASSSITVNLSGSITTAATADVSEFSGVASSSFLDQTKTDHNYGSSADTGTTSTTTQASELWIGGIMGDTSSASQASSINGFTLLDGTVNNYLSVGLYYKIVSSTGTAEAGCTLGGSAGWVGCIATFFAAGGATQINVSDASNAGADAVSLSTTVPVSDASNAGVDIITARGLGLADASNAGVDSFSMNASIPVADASNLTIDSASLSVTFSVSDQSNVSVDSVTVTVGGSTVTVYDASNPASDAVTVAVTLNLSDASVAADLESLIAQISVGDASNAAVDALLSLLAAISVSDASNLTVDAASVQALLSLLDPSNITADTISNLRAQIQAADTSTSIDAATLNALLQLYDASTSSDQVKTGLLQLLTRAVTLRGDGAPVVAWSE